jgi:hypothetical protein
MEIHDHKQYSLASYNPLKEKEEKGGERYSY